MKIRPAETEDIAAITAIYNDVLVTSTAIYRDVPVTVEDRAEWWRSQKEKGYPVLVAEDEEGILGFASFGDFRPWPGYRFTVEGTIHLAPSARRHGIGTVLFEELLRAARKLGKHVFVAGVDAENVPSLLFMEKIGAKKVAHLEEVGFKFGRYLDLVFFQILLDEKSA